VDKETHLNLKNICFSVIYTETPVLCNNHVIHRAFYYQNVHAHISQDGINYFYFHINQHTCQFFFFCQVTNGGDQLTCQKKNKLPRYEISLKVILRHLAKQN